MYLKNKITEKCPCCGRQVYRDQCGRFMLPTTDGKTNHFLTCKPLRQELDRLKIKREARAEAISNTQNEIQNDT